MLHQRRIRLLLVDDLLQCRQVIEINSNKRQPHLLNNNPCRRVNRRVMHQKTLPRFEQSRQPGANRASPRALHQRRSLCVKCISQHLFHTLGNAGLI